ncbi:LacI family DNA-binding transcriptional regulator [Nesterenkonia sp. CL21]|uniref:LacI family DNA-binding transcriptional regulator n=1 Tax=Nesterenkonia sp. CL21 TaxID=3064894 RepID=UPI00287A2084|nr:LacI family DNA-binding transcriptional regulator [Nesterenkonia sp. CL21]MDS2173266.1 LacI family DNA-binding transcriptional regulator [Nesterenkonia sp. CL21]
MGRGPTSKDVARLAGVSQSTVSYVMSGKRSISAETLRRVEEAMAALNYQPHAGARALAGSRTNTIAIVMPFASAYDAGQLMAFVEEFVLAARVHDYDVLLVTAEEGIEGLRRITGGRQCDAAVVMQVTAQDQRADLARTLDFPVIFIGVPEDTTGLACVDFDFEAAGRLLVEELADLGNTRLSVLGWGADSVDRDYNYIGRFARGVTGAAEAHRLPVDWHLAPAADGFAAVLDAGLHPDGGRTGIIMTAGLSGGMRALALRGLVPGRDADVVALCTEAEAEEQVVPLTAVSTQPRDVSRMVAERLFALIDAGRPAQEGVDIVPATLVRRASTGRA